MTARADTSAKKRIPLNRERLLHGAVALADSAGIGALTMRSLAEELGVRPMAIYHHVANKEEIIDGIIDLVFGEIGLPASDIGWREAVRQRAISAREVLARHPWATPLMESRANPGPATLRHHDTMLGTFRSAGFSVENTGHANSIVDSYVYGFALGEAALPFDKESATEVVEAMMVHFPADEYPHLAEFAVERVVNTDYDYGDEFEIGLDLILDGLGRFVHAG
jgi:AcrR family transcriptional regulator